MRASLDELYPEFTQLCAGLLSRYLGATAKVVVLSALESEPVQAYLQVADGIDADVNVSLRSFVARIGEALSSAHTA